MTTDFGEDLSCVEDFAEDGRTVTGRTLLAEAIARRLISPRGTLIGDPNYGYDVTDAINDDMSARDIASMRASIKAECLKDERVQDVKVVLTQNADSSLDIILDLVDADGPFRLVLAASEVTVSILSVT